METEQEKIPTLTQVQNAAIRLLSRREHSRNELRQKLLQRGFPAELIQQVLEKLIQKKLLDEERFVESYIRARSNKGYGPLRIIAELQQRGVNVEIIFNFIDETSCEWLELAQQVRQKKFGKKMPKEFTEKAKQMRFLQYRGFSVEQINKIFAAE
jgi:regulatory protein